MYWHMNACEELLCNYQVQWSQHRIAVTKWKFLSTYCILDVGQSVVRWSQVGWTGRMRQQWTQVISKPHRFCDWSVQLTVLCCDMVLPDHFPLHRCWILHLSLFNVSRYPSLLIVMPVESQSTVKIPCKSEKFFVLCMSMVFPLHWLNSFQVYETVTKNCSLWLTLWRNLCCHDQWISDGLMSSFDTNHVVYLCPENYLPFCNWCPCASTTRLGNDSSCFSLAHMTKTV